MPNERGERFIGDQPGRTITGESLRFGPRNLSDMPQCIVGRKAAAATKVRMTTRMKAVLARHKADSNN